MKKIKIEDIIIEKRILQEINDEKVREIAESIKQIGLLHPVIIDQDNHLISGLHRIEASKLLGKTEIIYRRTNYSTLKNKLIEIQENIARNQYSILIIGELLQKEKEILDHISKEKQNNKSINSIEKKNDLDFAQCAQNQTGLAKRTIYENMHLSQKIIPAIKEEIKNSDLKNSRTTLRKIAKMPQIEQEKFVKAIKEDKIIAKKWERTKKGKTTIDNVVKEIKIKEKPKINPKLPKEKFNVIYADPPWQYEISTTPNRIIEKEYPTMSLKELCKLKIPSADDCILFLWCTSPKLYPEGNEILKAWGFTYKTSMVWIKDRIGMGYYARQRHELLLIATKGNIGVPEPENRYDSVIEAPRQEHSKKPKEVYERIEKMYPQGKYLELFARNKREKWTSWGNEIEHETI